MQRRFTFLFLAGVIASILTVPAVLLAADKYWNRASDGWWNDNINWSPNGIPLDGDDVFIGQGGFPAGYLTTLNASDTVGTLTVMGGSRLATSAYQLQVNNGVTTVTGAGSTLFLEERTAGDFDSLDAEGVTISNGGRINMIGGVLELESGLLDIGSVGGGTLDGHGTVELVETGLGGSSALRNNGRIAVTRNFFDPLAVTMTITNFDTAGGLTGTGGVDLDGTTGDGIVDVDDGTSSASGNMTLVIEAQITDAYDGTMDIGRGDTVDMRNAQNPWSLGSAGVINMNGADGTATLKGQALTLNSGSRVNVNSGVGKIEAPLSAVSGQLWVGPNGTLHLANTSTVSPTQLILNAPTSGLEVSGTTNILNAGQDLDWDGQGGGATTTVSGSGRLTINVDNIDLNNDIFNGNLHLEDSGQLSVTVADGSWDMASNSTLNKNSSGTATLSGSRIVFAGDLNANAGTLVVNPEFVVGSASSVNVAAGANLTLNEDTLISAANLAIDGTLQLNGLTTWSGPMSVTGSGKIVNEGNAVFSGDTNINVAVFDWDQGVTTVNPDVAVNIDVSRVDTSNDTFNNNSINVNSGSLAVSVADGQWDLGSNGQLTLNKTGTANPTLSGDRLNVQSGGEVRVAGGEAFIAAPLTLQSGGNLVVQDPVRVNLDGPTTLAGGDIIGLVGAVTVVQDGNLTVTGASSITVTTYDWDEGSTTVEPAGALDINVTNIDAIAGQKYDQTLTMNSGNVDVNVAGNVWTMDGTLRMNNTTNDVPVLGGDTVFIGDGSGIGDALVRVDGVGTSRNAARTFYQSDADVNVDRSTTLEHTSNVTFNGGGTYTGNGQIDFRSNVTVAGTTTVDMAGGRIDFDAAGDTIGNTVVLNAPLTLNVDELLPFGQNTTSGTHSLTIDNTAGGRLLVNANTGSWEVAPEGVLNLTSDSGVDTLVTGSDLRLMGTMNVTGDVGIGARTTIGGTVNINTAGQPLRLSGSIANPNRLAGGIVTGVGDLSASSGAALFGHGTINTDVDFDGTAQLKADDGTLVINGAIVDAGAIGTADHDGILDVTNDWSTSNAPLRLAGGEIRGGDITNNGSSGIEGHGLISARITNESSIAANGGTLTIANGSDYSTPGNELIATSGNLELQSSNATHEGSMTISGGREVYLNNGLASFGFGSSSSLTMTGGTLRSSGNVDFEGGTIAVNSPSTIQVETDGSTLWFASGTTTNLNADLRVSAADGTTIFSGAVFSGGGAMINDVGASLELVAGADVGTTLVNEGLVDLDGVTTARADLSDFVQLDTGSLSMGLAGTLLTEFDRLVVSGAAQLDGTLDVELRGGFVPALGDMFPIISASGGILGTFATELLPSLGSDLEFDISYDGGFVSLEVVSTVPPCDFDGGGDCNLADIDDLYDALGTNNPDFDLDGNGIVDDDDIPLWLAEASASDPMGRVFLPGDTDLDGAILGNDFTIVASNFGTTGATWGQGNFNGAGSDGRAVGGSDFTQLAANFGFTSIQSVPEPTSLVLVLLASLVGCRVVRQRRRTASFGV